MPKRDLRDDARELLPWYRADPSLWSDIDFMPGAGLHDVHWFWRYALLIAMQFDRQPADEAFLRAIMAQETRYHIGLWSVSYSLIITAHLLSAYRHVENIPAFVEAKGANGDCAMAIDSDLFLMCGADAARQFLQHWNHPDRDWIMSRLFDSQGNPVYSQEECDKRWQEEERRFPQDPALVPLHEQISRAFAFENLELAEQLIQRYEETSEKNVYHYQEMSRLRRKLGQWKAALCALLAIIEINQPDELEIIRIIRLQLASQIEEDPDMQLYTLEFEKLFKPWHSNESEDHLALIQLQIWLAESQ